MNKNQNWNTEDWQGRTREQIEFSNKMAGIAFIAIIIIIMLSLVF